MPDQAGRPFRGTGKPTPRHFLQVVLQVAFKQPLRRAIQRFLEDPLSEKILSSEFSPGDEIEVTVSEDRQSLAFRVPSKTQTV